MLKQIVEYHDDEKTKIRARYWVDEDGREQGLYESFYYENGHLWLKCVYERGKYNGSCEEYFKNGQLKRKCTYTFGKYNGPFEAYYQNGQLEKKCTYTFGEYNGPFEAYYEENGQLRVKGAYFWGPVSGGDYYAKEADERSSYHSVFIEGEEAYQYALARQNGISLTDKIKELQEENTKLKAENQALKEQQAKSKPIDMATLAKQQRSGR